LVLWLNLYNFVAKYINMNELWDIIKKADTKRQLIGDIRSKEQKINELPKVCGSCDLWMTNQCQREKTRKVSNGMPICNDFKQQKWVTDLILKLNTEVINIKQQLSLDYSIDL
jgi:hypothetical protein